MKALLYLLIISLTRAQDRYTGFAKVYQSAQVVTAPSTDAEDALRQEKVRQLMKENKKDNYILFNHVYSKEKNDLIYKNSLRLDWTEKLIEIRRQNRKLGIFKIDKGSNGWEVLFGVSFVAFLVWLLLLLARKIKEVKDYIDECLLDALVVMTTDMLILSVILTTFNIIALYNLMIPLQMTVNVEQIYVAGITFIFLWLAASMVKIFRCQLKINKWDNFESEVCNQLQIYKTYATLKAKEKTGAALTKEEKVQLSTTESQVRYFNKRDDFIDPSYLPAVSENKFRPDFPFSDYLTICLANNLRGYLQFKVWCYGLVIGVLFAVILLVKHNNMFLMYAIPTLTCIGAAVFVILTRLHLMYISSQCEGNLQNDEMIEFTQLDGRNQGLKLTSIPKFLASTSDFTIPYLGSQNRQECMFFMRTPQLIVSLVKLAEMLVYAVVVITSPILFFYWPRNQAYFWLMLLAEVVSIAIVMFVTPGLLCTYSVVTNIIMLRNKENAQKAVEEQKKLLYASYKTVYR